MTRRRRPASRCSGPSTGIAAIVVQFGLAMMPLGAFFASSPLTSATTSGISGSLRKADELSITVAPAAAKRSACAREVAPPAENSAMSIPARSASEVAATSSTTMSSPRKGRVVPAERAEAKKRTFSAGKSRSSRSRRMTTPTCPVAPTTASVVIFRSPSRSCVDRGGLFAAEVERIVDRPYRIVEVGVLDQDRDADLRGGDQVDVDPGVGERLTEGRRDAGVALHARTDEGHLADVVVEQHLREPDLGLAGGEHLDRARAVGGRQGEGD